MGLVRPVGELAEELGTIPGVHLGAQYVIPNWPIGMEASIATGTYGYQEVVAEDITIRGQVVEEASVKVRNSIVHSSIGVVLEPLRDARVSPFAVIGAGHTSFRSMWRAMETIPDCVATTEEDTCSNPFIQESYFLGSSTTTSFNYGLGLRVDLARAENDRGRLSMVLKVKRHNGGMVRYLHCNRNPKHFDLEPWKIDTNDSFNARAEFFTGFVGLQYSLFGRP